MDRGVYMLVDHLRAHDHAAPASLADLFGVSARTVRTRVSQANAALEGVARVVHLRGHGYVLRVTDERALSQLMSRAAASLALFPSTPAGRVVYLLNELVGRSGWTTVGELAGMLAVSGKTVSSDLRKVEGTLSRFRLVLVRRPHYGVRVDGREADKRLCLANLVIKGEGRPEFVSSLANDETMGCIERCVACELGQGPAPIGSVALRDFGVHVRVALQRIRGGHCVPMDADLLKLARQTREYEATSRMMGRLSRELGVDFPEQEVAYAAVQLASEGTLGAPGAGAAGLVVPDDVWDVVSEMLDVVEREFCLDLHGDLELRMSLARHVVPLALRLRYRVGSSNPLLDKTREHYPLAYLMALESSKVLAGRYGSMPSDDEIGYIALLLALGMERRRAEGPRKDVLIVCDVRPSGMSLLAKRCREEFGEHVGTIRTCDVSALDEVDWTGVGYVFTTAPLDRQLPVPVCQVSVFLDDEDVRKVRDVLAGGPRTQFLSQHFSPRLFLAHQAPATKGELLERLCDLVERHEGLSGEFRQGVLLREAAARTAFGNRVAIPHPLEPLGARTVVAVGLLDRPLDWGGSPVQAVFLVSVDRNGGEDLHEFNHALADFVSDRERVDQLIADQRYETLERLLDAPAGRCRECAPERRSARQAGDERG